MVSQTEIAMLPIWLQYHPASIYGTIMYWSIKGALLKLHRYEESVNELMFLLNDVPVRTLHRPAVAFVRFLRRSSSSTSSSSIIVNRRACSSLVTFVAARYAFRRRITLLFIAVVFLHGVATVVKWHFNSIIAISLMVPLKVVAVRHSS